MEADCAEAAAEAAFTELQKHLDIDIEEEEWAWPGWTYDGEYSPFIQITFTLNPDESVQTCPDPAFDLAKVRSHLPSEATVTLQFSKSDESYECTHEIELLVTEQRLL